MGLIWGLIQSFSAIYEPQHQTRRGLPVTERFMGWTTKDEARPVRKLSFQPNRGGTAQLGGVLGLLKRSHPKDVEAAVVPWMRGQTGELGAACHSRYLKMENGGDVGRHISEDSLGCNTYWMFIRVVGKAAGSVRLVHS